MREQDPVEKIEEINLYPLTYKKFIFALDQTVFVQNLEDHRWSEFSALSGKYIDLKAEENLKSKSLKTIYDNNPKLKPVSFSMTNYREQEWLVNVPLYLTNEWVRVAE